MIGLIVNILRISLLALRKNLLRTLLTMLGIIIGVASVVAMMGIGTGSKESIESQVNNLGTNMIIIFPASTSYGGVASGAGTNQNLTVDDATAMRIVDGMEVDERLGLLQPLQVGRRDLLLGQAEVGHDVAQARLIRRMQEPNHRLQATSKDRSHLFPCS